MCCERPYQRLVTSQRHDAGQAPAVHVSSSGLDCYIVFAHDPPACCLRITTPTLLKQNQCRASLTSEIRRHCPGLSEDQLYLYLQQFGRVTDVYLPKNL